MGEGAPTTAWAVALALLPLLALPAYWAFGRSRFGGYVHDVRQFDAEVDARLDEAQDALRVTVDAMTNAPMQEQFEIRFANISEDSATMTLHWDTVGAPVQIAAHSM